MYRFDGVSTTQSQEVAMIEIALSTVVIIVLIALIVGMMNRSLLV